MPNKKEILLDPKDYYNTKDYAIITKSKHLTILGRASRMVIINGENIQLEHVELPSIFHRIPTGPMSIAIALILVTSASIFSYNESGFVKRTAALEAVKVGDHLYKVSFPFLGGSTVFEETLRQFQENHQLVSRSQIVILQQYILNLSSIQRNLPILNPN